MWKYGLAESRTAGASIFLCILLCATVSLAQTVTIATLIMGACEFRESGASSWTPAAKFAGLHDGNELRTGSTGPVMVLINATGSRLFLDERTHVGLGAEFKLSDGRPEKERVILHEGQVMYLVRRDVHPVSTVETAAGVFTAEYGKIFVSFADSSNTCEVCVLEGRGAFRTSGADSGVTVEKGYVYRSRRARLCRSRTDRRHKQGSGGVSREDNGKREKNRSGKTLLRQP